MINNKVLNNAWDIVDNLADDNTKEKFQLDDMLYDISMKIFDYRMKNKLSQKKLADILGIKQSMVSKLESGLYNPTVEQLWKISQKLGWKFEMLLEDKTEVSTQIWDNAYSDDSFNDKDAENKLVVGA